MTNYCIDCKKEISRNGIKRCKKCWYKFNTKKNHPKWKGGLPKCIDCGVEISQGRKRCKECWYKANSGKNNGNYKHGKRKCIDCNGQVKNFYAKRCSVCAHKNKIGTKNPEHSERMRGANNPSWKGGLPKCMDCRIEIDRNSKRCNKCSDKFQAIPENNPHWKGGTPKCADCGIKLKLWNAKRCKKCWYKKIFGKNNPSWRGGISKLPYSADWTTTLKQSIKERDGYACQICGKQQKTFAVHHIDYNKKNCNPDNLITLCINCHSKTTGNREYWKKYFRVEMSKKSKDSIITDEFKT